MADGSIAIELEVKQNKFKAQMDKVLRTASKIGDDIAKEFEDVFSSGDLLEMLEKAQNSYNYLLDNHDKWMNKLSKAQAELNALSDKSKKQGFWSDEDLQRSGQLDDTIAEATAKMKENEQAQSQMLELIKETETALKSQMSIERDEQKEQELALKQQIELEKQAQKEKEAHKKSIEGIINKLGKYSAVLLGVRGAIGILRRGVSAYMQANEEMRKNLQGVWNAMGEMLAPAIEFIINLFMKAIAIVNAFILALTGINIVAKANAKALAKQNSQMNGASFDEQNKLGGGGSSANTLSLPEVDSAQLKFLDDIADRLKKLYEVAIKPVLEGLNLLADTLRTYVQPIFEVFTKNVLYPITDAIIDLGSKVGDLINGALTTLANWFEKNRDFIISVFDKVSKTITDFYTGIVLPIWSLLIDAIGVVGDIIWDLWDNTIWPVAQYLFEKLWPVIDEVIQWSVKALKVLFNWVKENIFPIVKDIWNNMKPYINLIGEAIKWIVDKVIEYWPTLKEWVNKALGWIEGFANGMIKMINWLITKLNGLSVDIPDWSIFGNLAGKHFGVNLRTISELQLPRLAQGGIINRPTQALIGEAGKEAVLPLENNTEWMDELASKIGGGDITIYVQMDGKTISKEVRKANDKFRFRTNGGY